MVVWVAMAFWYPHMAKIPLSAQIRNVFIVVKKKKAHEIYFLTQLLSVQSKCFNRITSATVLVSYFTSAENEVYTKREKAESERFSLNTIN